MATAGYLGRWTIKRALNGIKADDFKRNEILFDFNIVPRRYK
jgi:hypothetical protein